MSFEVIGLTYNVMAPVPEPIRFQGQNDRMMRIPAAIARSIDTLERLDFIVVQESMSSDAHNLLSAGLYNMGFVYETDQLVGDLSAFKIVQGGLVLFSRFPIITHKTKVFDGICSREDCLCAKGCLYTRIEKYGQPINIFSIHVQAWECEDSRNVRRVQFIQFKRFIDDMNVPSCEPLIVMGDFNMDMYSQQKQVQRIMKCLNVDILPRHAESHPFTSDPSTNVLMGIDDASSYSSPSFPNGCGESYLKSGKCVCCPCEWLDYAACSTAHAPIQKDKSYMRVIPLKTDAFITNLTWTQKRELCDLSDHYPVLAKYVFPTIKPNLRIQNRVLPYVQTAHDKKHVEPLVYNLSFFIVLAVFIAIFCLFIVWMVVKKAK